MKSATLRKLCCTTFVAAFILGPVFEGCDSHGEKAASAENTEQPKKTENPKMAENSPPAESNKGEKFLAENKTKEGVITTASGLQYKVLTEGSGKSPTATDTVVCHYRGTLLDGTEFDSSYKRGEPAEFPLNRVIPGWTEGIQKINKGGKIRLYIPANLAYGDDGRPGIPPGAALIFNVELLDIKPTGTAPAPGGAPGGGSMSPPPGATP